MSRAAKKATPIHCLPAHPLASAKPDICAVCRGHTMGGDCYMPRGAPIPIRACDDHSCRANLMKVYDMPKEHLEGYERKAALEGGRAAGHYLDMIDKFHLDQLTVEEWEKFCGKLVSGFQDGMRRMIAENEPPF